MFTNVSAVKHSLFNSTASPAPLIASIFATFNAVAAVINLVVFIYIVSHRLYRCFVSSHFIAHLCVTNAVALLILVPTFVVTVWTGHNPWIYSNLTCRLQAFLTCTVWTVINFMGLCIAGVHLLTFARIHYEQLFGLQPNTLCILAWLVAVGLSLPTITNGHVVVYEKALRHCVWGDSDSGLKFLTYLLIIGLFIPASLEFYAYIRVLGILYHSPIVFQSIGLYKSRFLIYGFITSSFSQLPFYLITVVNKWRQADGQIPMTCTFLAYAQCIISPVLYGASLFLLKEEDMTLTNRAHKTTNAHQMAHNV
ncbi:unnamed protein product [Enterobius vermicularis]|uniref:G_PROTEIN_RECEP_F1_2 domain-containing protein n=1 Tax=Enterobius vermicularis TaxID=51028 RepID=A0A0N4VHV2_ENTVE|nr:unnamed protein product [Enterobius vermicularis]